jgi:hypothetical protein
MLLKERRGRYLTLLAMIVSNLMGIDGGVEEGWLRGVVGFLHACLR